MCVCVCVGENVGEGLGRGGRLAECCSVQCAEEENEKEYKKKQTSNHTVGAAAATGGEVIENMSNYFLRFMWSSTRAENVSNACLDAWQKKKKKNRKIKKRKKSALAYIHIVYFNSLFRSSSIHLRVRLCAVGDNSSYFPSLAHSFICIFFIFIFFI